MSARSWFWRELGLDRTDDLRAIRRAYAAKLRAIDPDADADAFQRLRDAREYALADAAHFSAPADDFAFEDDLAFGEGCSESLPLSDHASPSVVLDDQAASPGEATDELDEPYRRLFALLLPEPPREEPLEPAEEADLCSAFQSILADPRLSGIAFHAEVVALACARVRNPLVRPAHPHCCRALRLAGRRGHDLPNPRSGGADGSSG